MSKPNPHAQALGRLGGRKLGAKLAPDHRAKVTAALVKARAARLAQAARVAAMIPEA